MLYFDQCKKYFFTLFSVIVMFLFNHALLKSDELIDLKNNEYMNKDNNSFRPIPPLLKTYVEKAIVNNSSLKAMNANWLSYKKRVIESKSLKDPNFSVLYFAEPIETANGSQRGQVSLSQVIPWFGTNKTKESIANKLSDKKYWEFQQGISELVGKIYYYYFEYAFIDKEISITQDVIELSKQLEPIIKSKIKNGGSQSDLLKLQVTIKQIEDELFGLIRSRTKFNIELKTLLQVSDLNLKDKPELIIPKESKEKIKFYIENLKRKFVKKNPLLKSKEESIYLASHKMKLAILSNKPEFKFGIKYVDINDNRSNNRDSGKDALGLSFAMSIPLWNNKNKSKRESAYAQKKKAVYELEKIRWDINKIIETQLAELMMTRDRIDLYVEEIIPGAKQIYDLDLVAYTTGQKEIKDILSDLNDLLKYKKLKWKAVKNFEQAFSILEVIKGRS